MLWEYFVLLFLLIVQNLKLNLKDSDPSAPIQRDPPVPAVLPIATTNLNKRNTYCSQSSSASMLGELKNSGNKTSKPNNLLEKKMKGNTTAEKTRDAQTQDYRRTEQRATALQSCKA